MTHLGGKGVPVTADGTGPDRLHDGVRAVLQCRLT